MLERILSKEVMDGLQRGEHKVLRYHECVTVFLADVVGYTELCLEYPMQDMVDAMDELFSLLDELAGVCGVTKVGTAGETYMAVTGCDNASHCNQVTRMLQFSSAAMDAAASVRLCDGRTLAMRVGVHSGPALSGVVGRTRPRFCFFGQTVNYASRMESTSVAMRVHVSDVSAALLRGEHRAPDGALPRLLRRGVRVALKGIGTANTWFLEQAGRCEAEGGCDEICEGSQDGEEVGSDALSEWSPPPSCVPSPTNQKRRSLHVLPADSFARA
jgi:class 3 adenylate cyclase